MAKPNIDPKDDDLQKFLDENDADLSAMLADLESSGGDEVALGEFWTGEKPGDVIVLAYTGAPVTKHGRAVKGETEAGNTRLVGGKGVTAKMPEQPDGMVYVFVFLGMKKTTGGEMKDYKIVRYEHFSQVPESVRRRSPA